MEKLLVGRWRLSPEDRHSLERLGDHAMEFTPFGDLIYSTFNEEGVVGRILMVYQLDRNILVMDQPSAPRKERTPFRINTETLLLGNETDPIILTRENPQMPSDPIAYMLAIGGAAVNHGLDSAHKGGPFIPFLIADNEEIRSLARLVNSTPQEARTQAQRIAHENHPKACAFASDGYVYIGNSRLDAVLVEVSQIGLPNGLLLAQAYTFKGRRAIRVERMSMQENPSWF